MIFILLFLIYLHNPALCVGICNLSKLLSDGQLEGISDDCAEVNGNLVIDESVNLLNYSLLVRKFENVTSINGCVNIRNSTLGSFDFMSNVRTINCSLSRDKNIMNVIEIKYNRYLVKLAWDSLETVIGPGIIDLEDTTVVMCLSLQELEVFLPHPQYQGDEWIWSFNGGCPKEKVCTLNYHSGLNNPFPTRYLPPPDEIPIPEGCRVLIQFDLNSQAIGYMPIFDRLKTVRIIIGGITIENSWLTNLSFFSNVEMIFTTGTFTDFPIRLNGNPYMTDISLPKLRKFKNSKNVSVVVEESPRLSDKNPYPNVTNLFVPPFRTYGLNSMPRIDYRGSSNFVRITSRKRLDGDTFLFNTLIYGMYYPPIAISILFNLIAATLFCLGNAKHAIGSLRWFYITFILVHILIATDSVILYHDLNLVYFTPAPLLPRTIFYNDVLLLFSKTMFVVREIAKDLPLAAIVYIYIVAIMYGVYPAWKALFKRSHKLVTLIYFSLLAIYACFKGTRMYSVLDVRARRTINKISTHSGHLFFTDATFPNEKYTMIAGMNGKFSDESIPFWNGEVYVAIYETTIYTDGLRPTYFKQQLEYVTIGLFGVFMLIKFLDRRDRLAKLPFDCALIVILIQYAALRYAVLRNYLIRRVYPITCFASVDCAERHSYDHTIAMVTHHSVYVLMGVGAVLVWYTSRYYHYLGAVMKTESQNEAAKQEDKTL